MNIRLISCAIIGGDGHEAHGVYGETIEDKIYMSLDMTKKATTFLM